jgi:hypothetical protein
VAEGAVRPEKCVGSGFRYKTVPGSILNHAEKESMSSLDQRIAVKVVDDRGIESLRILELE